MLDGGKGFTALVDGVGLDGGVERGARCCAAASDRCKRSFHTGVWGRQGAIAGRCTVQRVGVDHTVGEDQAVKGCRGSAGDCDRLIQAWACQGQGVVHAVGLQRVVGQATGEVDFVVRTSRVAQVIGQPRAHKEGIFEGRAVVLNALARSGDCAIAQIEVNEVGVITVGVDNEIFGCCGHDFFFGFELVERGKCSDWVY